MIFQEKPIRELKKIVGYSYKVEDIFGQIEIESRDKLTAEILDSVVVGLLRSNISAQTVIGSTSYKDNPIKYTFKKASVWEDDVIEEPKNLEGSAIHTRDIPVEEYRIDVRLYRYIKGLLKRLLNVLH